MNLNLLFSLRDYLIIETASWLGGMSEACFNWCLDTKECLEGSECGAV